MAIEVYGIDLGTTYSVLARLDENGTPRIIPNNAEGKDTLASAVYFPEGGDPVVGEQAKQFRDTEKDRVIECAKRYIGRSGDEGRKYTIDGKTYDPIDISTLFLKRIKAYASDQGYDVEKVVITCPAYFKDPQRVATIQAAENAGMKVLNIVNEPTAAAIAYCKDEYPENRRILVYDLGGGTFDVSIIEFTKRQDNTANVNVVDSTGNDMLGGKDWDAILSDMICAKVADEAGVSESDVKDDVDLMAQINCKCEETKICLTAMEKKTVIVNYNGEKIKISITQTEFEEKTQGLVKETIDFVTALLNNCKFQPSDIDTVLLVGGSTFMPMIRKAVATVFPEDRVKSYQPNLAVAIGAAISATLEIKKDVPSPSGDDGLKIVEQPLSSSYGVRVRVREKQAILVNNLLLKGQAANSEAFGDYETSEDNQERIVAHVYSNDSTEEFIPSDIDYDGNPVSPDPELMLYHIGELELKLPPNTPAKTPIKVTFRHETMGLQVEAINQITQERNEALINFSSDGVKSQKEMEEAKDFMDNIRTRPELDD